MRSSSLLVLFFLVAVAVATSADDLTVQIRQGEVAAIKQAGDAQRHDLIGVLEEANQLPGRHNEPARYWSQKVLAKLGVKKYWEEIVAELVAPTNTAVYQRQRDSYRNMGIDSDPAKFAQWDVQTQAFGKLGYVNDISAVKYIGGFLASEEYVDEYGGGDAPRGPLAFFALETLRGMNLIDAPANPNTTWPALKEWQAWWEQHKDYYEKLEFGKPAPPWPGTNATSQPPSVPDAVNPKANPATVSPVPTASPVTTPSPAVRPWLWWLVGASVLALVVAWFLGHHRRQ